MTRIDMILEALVAEVDGCCTDNAYERSLIAHAVANTFSEKLYDRGPIWDTVMEVLEANNSWCMDSDDDRQACATLIVNALF